MTKKEVMLKLGFIYNETLKIYVFKNEYINLTVKISNNQFGYYKIDFDVNYGIENYKFTKWSYSQDLSLNHYMFDCLNMYCCYGYLLKNFNDINIKELLPDSVYDISGNNSLYKIRFAAIDRLFKDGYKNKVEHYQNNNKIQILPNDKGEILYLPLDFNILKEVLEFENTPEKIDYSSIKIYNDNDFSDIENLQLKAYHLRGEKIIISNYKFEALYHKNYFSKSISVDFHIIDNYSKLNNNLFLFRVREEDFISLSNFNYKILEKLIDLTKNHILLKY